MYITKLRRKQGLSSDTISLKKKKKFKLSCPIIWTGLGSSLGNNISILMQTVNRCGLKLLKDLKTKDQALNFWLENREDSKQMGKHFNIIWL